MAAASLFLHHRRYLFLHHCNSLSSANPLPCRFSFPPRRASWNRLRSDYQCRTNRLRSEINHRTNEFGSTITIRTKHTGLTINIRTSFRLRAAVAVRLRVVVAVRLRVVVAFLFVRERERVGLAASPARWLLPRVRVRV
ncbi:hypothetical protein LOK49_LG12G02254 [Camellia lanceoleosa]|uniref:Uncharacterized protein n=1 Tax=Camellia lanceoleosa TaxID=1840588 RepID=A0ACC0FSY7_9ERIC|nr:hypothetical protein LOK49_LG12G02254 [Camellia lanceoleosa]